MQQPLQAEGVAYRGRILVEVITILDKTLPKVIPAQRINSSDMHQRVALNNSMTQAYKLMGVFFSGNMIHPGNKEVEFEISIGKSLFLLWHNLHPLKTVPSL